MLAKASEVFLTNALGLRPVVRIGETPVGDGEPGLITQLLARRAFCPENRAPVFLQASPMAL